MCPDSQTEIAECNGLVVLNEKRLTGCCLGGDQVLRSQDMCIGYVGHIRDIPQVGAAANHKGSLPFSNACVDRWKELRVSRATEHRRPERAGCHYIAVSLKN